MDYFHAPADGAPLQLPGEKHSPLLEVDVLPWAGQGAAAWGAPARLPASLPMAVLFHTCPLAWEPLTSLHPLPRAAGPAWKELCEAPQPGPGGRAGGTRQAAAIQHAERAAGTHAPLPSSFPLPLLPSLPCRPPSPAATALQTYAVGGRPTDPVDPAAPPGTLVRYTLWVVLQLCTRGSLSEGRGRGRGADGGVWPCLPGAAQLTLGLHCDVSVLA